jgi:hypothetical protein
MTGYLLFKDRHIITPIIMGAIVPAVIVTDLQTKSPPLLLRKRGTHRG